jgi:hypothetical protein
MKIRTLGRQEMHRFPGIFGPCFATTESFCKRGSSYVRIKRRPTKEK